LHATVCSSLRGAKQHEYGATPKAEREYECCLEISRVPKARRNSVFSSAKRKTARVSARLAKRWRASANEVSRHALRSRAKAAKQTCNHAKHDWCMHGATLKAEREYECCLEISRVPKARRNSVFSSAKHKSTRMLAKNKKRFSRPRLRVI